MAALIACELMLDAVIELVDRELMADTGRRTVRLRIDRWMVELIAEVVETNRPSEIRAFVREAIMAHIGRPTTYDRA